MKYTKQMPEEYYHFLRYISISRWVSYYWQIYYIYKLAPDSILEIGPGTNIIKKIFDGELEYITMDLDTKTDSDIKANVTEIPFKSDSVDLVLCSQVLEHIPFLDFQRALKEAERVTRKWVILSLPYSRWTFQCKIRFPWGSKLARKIVGKILRTGTSAENDINALSRPPKQTRLPGLSMNLNIPKFFINHKFDGTHYWEIGKKNYSFNKISKLINNYMIIKETYYPPEHPYHQLFILKKRI